jgi:hypothetical protein
MNVAQSSGTLLFGDPHSVGSKLTLDTARRLKKPFFIVDWRSGWPAPHEEDVADARQWLLRIDVLNVAGNRESRQSGIRDATRDFLLACLRVTE